MSCRRIFQTGPRASSATGRRVGERDKLVTAMRHPESPARIFSPSSRCEKIPSAKEPRSQSAAAKRRSNRERERALKPGSRMNDHFNFPIFCFDEHHEAFYWWHRARIEGRLAGPADLLHIDGQDDMGPPWEFSESIY